MTNRFEELPVEVQLLIISTMKLKDLYSLLCTNHNMKDLVQSTKLYKTYDGKGRFEAQVKIINTQLGKDPLINHNKNSRPRLEIKWLEPEFELDLPFVKKNLLSISLQLDMKTDIKEIHQQLISGQVSHPPAYVVNQSGRNSWTRVSGVVIAKDKFQLGGAGTKMLVDFWNRTLEAERISLNEVYETNYSSRWESWLGDYGVYETDTRCYWFYTPRCVLILHS
eukprot:TRINITY_DN26477_c0_g1_i1.p1 TRINITY_DN26477_c0_g1~~TRINITY_DN26477_c0_g1_i1.p1  ORF type:complete len:223 (-),score=22.21 TRINITY_DN26477_c0_g1_i1:153-821(-)